MNNKHLFPRDFFSWILLVFVIGSITLTGYGQLKLIGLLLAGSYTLYFLVKKLWVPEEMIIYFVWIVWSGTTGYIVSIDKEIFFKTFIVVSQIMIMSFAISGITAKQRSLNPLFSALLIGSIILFLSSFFSGELFEARNVESQLQVTGLTANPNDYGYSFLICTAALLYFWGTTTWKKRIIIILIATIFLFAIISSGSRKAFIGFVLLILMWQFMNNWKAIIKKPYIAIFIVLVIGGLYLASDYMLSNTYMGIRFQKDFIEDPITERHHKEFNRITYYKEGLELIKNNPIFGIGLGNFAVLSSLGKESHSDYIEVASSTGIVGFLMYFSIYVLLWRRLSWIQKQVKEVSVIYNIGLFKAIIFTILVIATGRPNLTAQVTWVLLSGIIGYTWDFEKRIRLLNGIRK